MILSPMINNTRSDPPLPSLLLPRDARGRARASGAADGPGFRAILPLRRWMEAHARKVPHALATLSGPGKTRGGSARSRPAGHAASVPGSLPSVKREARDHPGQSTGQGDRKPDEQPGQHPQRGLAQRGFGAR